MAEASAIVLLVTALLAGGGSRGLGDAAVQVAALPVLVFALLRWRPHGRTRLERGWMWACLAGIAWMALQLLPLPAALFGALPMRAATLSDLHQAGLDGPLPLSLDRWGTVRALMAAIVTTAFFALACTLAPAARRRLLIVALGVGTLTALLGYAQAAAGSHSPLRLYDFHHPIGAIGTFANRNHFASLMAMLLPFAMALGVQAQLQQRLPAALGAYAVTAVLFLAAALSFSRAGLALASLSVLASLVLLRPGAWQRAHAAPALRQRLARAVPLVAVAVAVAGIAAYASDGISHRLAQDPLEDLRWQYLQYGWDAARAYLPWGSGFGTFRWVYAPFEPLAAMGPTYALHAHNDYLELLVEAGLPGCVLLVTFLGMHISSARKSLIDHTLRAPILRSAAIAASVPWLHALVDYPLRTYAIALVLALCWSFLLSDAEAAPR